MNSSWRIPAAVFLFFTVLFAWTHARPDGLVERDGYYHARVAQLLPSRGISRSFRWTQASTWRDRYVDKEFLYHVLMAPFARGDKPVRGALVFSVLLSAAVFAGFALWLRRLGVPLPWLGALVLGCMGGPFLLRMSFIRAHVLSVGLFILGLALLMERRRKALALLGFFYSWSYSFPIVLPVFAAAVAAGKCTAGEKFDWRSVFASLGGVVLGLIIHPYTPHSIGNLGVNLSTLTLGLFSRQEAVVEVGREFAPYSTRAFLQSYPFMTLGLIGLGAAGWRSKRALSSDANGLFCGALCALIATMIYPRMAEYAAPLAAAAFALAWRDYFNPETIAALKEQANSRNISPNLIGLGLASLLAGAQLYTLSYIAQMTDPRANPPPRFGGAARWMGENLKERETVVHLWWDDFPELFYQAPRQNYLVGLDPAYMLHFDRKTAARIEGMRRGRQPLDPAWLAEKFDARYMIIRRELARFYPQLRPNLWRPVYADRYAAIYALTGANGPAPRAARGLPMIPALPGARLAR